MKKIVLSICLALMLGLPAISSGSAISHNSTALLPNPPGGMTMQLAVRIIKEAQCQIEQGLGYTCPLGLLIRGYVQGELTITRLGPVPNSPGLAYYEVRFKDAADNEGIGIILADDSA